jgi:hypothetical protein
MNGRPAKAKTSVCWFAPLQLLRTAQQVAIATVFGQNADARVIEALARPLAGTTLGPGTLAKTAEGARRTPGIHDYSGKHAPFWIDYIADTGDGWDATYTVAYYASQPTLALGRAEAAPGTPLLSTRRGDILILGGDEVYPFANYEDYERRLVLPYSCAFPPDEAGSHDSPEVFAIPGNHDWYDSLVSFSRLFCSKQSFAGWRTPQTRSYFALKLPGSWWLLGTDIQLGSEIDGPQREFFQAVAEGMTPEDKVILCHAEPHWLYETIYPATYRYRSVHELESNFGKRIKLYLAGDCHFYMRHEGPGAVQKIIAGGGGAFGHVTFGPDDSSLRRRRVSDDAVLQGRLPAEDVATGYEKRCVYPPVRTSFLSAAALPFLFHWKNPTFGLATAVAYGITGEAMLHPNTVASSLDAMGREALTRVFTDPFSLFWLVTIVFGVIFFTDTHSPAYRWTGGFVHSVTQVVAALLVAWAAAVATQGAIGAESIWQPLATITLTALGGYLVGPLILSLYLLISLLAFRRHRNDVSSALRSPDFKNFIRLTIDENETLTIFPIGISKAATKWTAVTGGGSKLMPQNGTEPILIEEPVSFPPPLRAADR